MDGGTKTTYRDNNGNIKEVISTWYFLTSGDFYTNDKVERVASATRALWQQISPLNSQLSNALSQVNAKESKINTLQSEINTLKAKNEAEVAELNGKLLALSESNKKEVVEATTGTASSSRKFTFLYLAGALIALYMIKTA